tara:strand:- start:690 stop:1868 length:1179 start_codon:yes stop_codon:yes gene_type:complete
MEKILVIHNKYKNFGGEDSNIIDELEFLRKYFYVEYLEFDNSKKITVYDFIAFFTNSNNLSNRSLIKTLNEFEPDIVYVHNTWFKSNLGIFKILKERKVKTLLKLHNFRYDCTNSYLAKKHFKGNNLCPKCGLKEKKFTIFNKYFENSYLKSFFVTRYGKKYFNILKTYPLHILVMNNFHNKYLKSLGVYEEKVSISLNPMNFDSNNSKEYNKDSNYVLYAGMISESKGVSELVSSWLDLDMGGLNLKIIGTGDIENKLKKEYSHKSVEFLGELGNQETISQIKNARAVITATKMYEGQPRLLCEASSLGVPSIYPSFGGMDEFFPPDYNLSFEQYNYSDLKKKLTLLKDTNFVISEGQKAYNHIKKKLDSDYIAKGFIKTVNNMENNGAGS